MRVYIKNKILELIRTIYEVHDEIIKSSIDKNLILLQELIGLCIEGMQSIKVEIQETDNPGSKVIKYMDTYTEEISNLEDKRISFEELELKKSQLDNLLSKIEKEILCNIKEKYEIVFLPYKSSMWDSLESIWLTAQEDNQCNARVIPIPYFERNSDGTFGIMRYEGKDFPDYVPITHYKDYNLEEKHPDIIYIHNPYDNFNRVTSIHPQYYSNVIKEFTSILVYVPYFISGYYSNRQTAKTGIPLCIDNIDFAILQCKKQKKVITDSLEYQQKIVALGSPKIDYIINHEQNIQIPYDLERKINRRKCILYNAPLTEFLSGQDWEEKMNNLINYFANHKELFLIWRPHPLLYTTMKSMRPFLNEVYENIIHTLEGMDNVEIDERASADVGIKVSDALISDLSSIVCQYTATGKPTLITTGKSNDRYSKIVNFDYFDNYFINDGITMEDFIESVVLGEDTKKQARKKSFESSIENSDGTCGRKIHQYMIQQLKKFNFKF